MDSDSEFAISRIMDKIMPLDVAEVDSTTKYRQAAHVGGKALSDGTSDVCGKMFAVCGFSTQQIIQLGDIAVPTPQNDPKHVTTNEIPAPPAPSTFRNVEEMDANSGV